MFGKANADAGAPGPGLVPAKGMLGDLADAIDLCPEVHAQLASALVDDCPLSAKDGNIIRGGYSGDLDKLRDLASGGKQWIARYQAEQAQATGIANLKVA